ncbi:MAG: hypothetical protein BWY74_00588 [Firmicutes bacterium ADurb.Bin419]|nr:MAG: hypothetical protein BWY74_00588 [Firmicutes bacterium ADurb.Bin419]
MVLNEHDSILRLDLISIRKECFGNYFCYLLIDFCYRFKRQLFLLNR